MACVRRETATVESVPIRMATGRLSILLPCLIFLACGEPDDARDVADTIECDEAAARVTVERIGERLRNVSLLAPDSVVRRDLRTQYAQLVTPELLDRWLADPASAPGRQVSSPWPARIAIRSITAAPEGCLVQGDVLYVTSADSAAGTPEPVTLTVRNGDGWRVSAYEVSDPPAADIPEDSVGAPDAGADADPARDARAAIEVVERYYAAINDGDHRRAYALWRGAGEASGQTFAEFERGFRDTREVSVEIGRPGRIEGAAGSRYVTVPVELVALHADGRRESFAGTYTLQRAVVDGASEEQRRWRIHSAEISRR